MYPVAVAADGVARLWDCGSAKAISDLANLGTVINGCALGVSPEQVHQKNTSNTLYMYTTYTVHVYSVLCVYSQNTCTRYHVKSTRNLGSPLRF